MADYYRHKPSKRIPKDGYEAFYKFVFWDNYIHPFDKLSLPPDYKESVLYILDQGTFKEKHVLIAKRLCGIGKVAKETPKSIAMDLGMTEANVKAYIDIVKRNCRQGILEKILLQGITAFKESTDDLTTLPDEIKTLQTKWQTVNEQYVALQDTLKKTLNEMRTLENEFAAKHGITALRAKNIARKPAIDRTYLEAERLIHTKNLTG